MMDEPTPVYLKHLPRDVAEELDRRLGLVVEGGGSGHISAHVHDSEVVKFEHRAVGTRRPVKDRR